MTHWSKATGTGAVVASYLLQAGMILWGPPPVKAFGLAWAAFPGMDPIIFGIGYSVGAGIGHSDDEILKVDVFTGLVSVFKEPECNPFHPDWSKRCLKVKSFF